MAMGGSVENGAGAGERRGGKTDRRVGIAPVKVGTNVDWDDVRERRVGTNDRRDGITDGAGGKKVGTTDSGMVGTSEGQGGINGGGTVGTNVDWDDLREKRVGTNDRRVGISGDGRDGASDGVDDDKVGITDRRVGISDRRVGMDDGGVGIIGDAVGTSFEWDDLREKRVGMDDRRVGTSGGDDGEVGTTGGRVGTNITQNQRKILGCIAGNQRITMAELSAAVGISTRKIEANVQKLKSLGLIERAGARKNGRWIVKAALS